MKQTGVGLVGAGWMGSVLLQRLAERADVEVRAVVGRNAERGRKLLAEIGLSAERWTDDFERMLADPAIDAVFIVSPNASHGPQSLAALRAGKHVFCEKPCATSYADYRAQVEWERRHPGVITVVDYLMHFDTMETRLRSMVAAGEFGKITQIQLNYRHPVNIAGEKVWKLSRQIMGDAIGMGIIHSLSSMVRLMESQTQPARVFATSLPAQVRNFEPEPIWNILVQFDNGATGFCFGNIDSGNGYDAYHNLSGTAGAFVFDSQLDRPQKVRFWSQRSTGGSWLYPLDPSRCERDGVAGLAWDAQTTTPDSGDVLQHQTAAGVAHFLDCIQTATPSPLSFANSAAVAELGWAAQMSAAQGQPVRLPLDDQAAQRFFANQPTGG